MSMDASAEPTLLALDESMNVSKRAGSRKRPSVSANPTRSAPTSAPPIEPSPPNDDDDEGEDQHGLAHAHLHRLDRAHQGAGEARQRRAEREHRGVELPDVDPEGGDHLPVGFAGPDADAEARPRDQEKEPGGDQQPDQDDRKAEEGVVDAAGERDRA